MVLSNKKLKQNLRCALAESLAATEAADKSNESTQQDVKSQSQSLKELLSSATHKPRFSKREKKRKNTPLKVLEGSNGDSQNGSKDTVAEDLNEKKNKKKRKREDKRNQKSENGVSELTEKKPTKKSKKKAKKKKKNKGVKPGSGEVKEVLEQGSAKLNESQVSGDVATKVYVGGIPYYSTEDDIRSFFESCGTITEIDCLSFPETGKFRGIAMITFKTEAAAKRALALDGADMGGLFLKIQPYKITLPHDSSDFAPPVVEGYNRIYIGNLSWDITEDELRKVFSDCNISSIRFGKDKETGEFRGYAHVDFSDSLSQAMALTLDQKVVSGRPVKIRCAVPKKETKTHPISEAAAKETKTHPISEAAAASKNNENGGLSSGSGKKMKRRTCYECGVPGHLSSACPKKKAVDSVNSTSN
ncbi:phragmoplastin interacting protein 1 [Macadamia integrifolia]|uniref:phragmoplastin interacting protein 1 n=1 Tax=Macadamia integrifolia TaxID=60698 RepID=UPI001C528368|nr:phragmoplastin interacting protein 1 [Macadamia integrifolia]